MVSAPPARAVPGQILGPRAQFLPGPGTHVHNGQVCASILGSVSVTEPAIRPQPAPAAAKQSGAIPKRLTKISAAFERPPASQGASPTRGGQGGAAASPIETLPMLSVSRTSAATNSGSSHSRQVLPEVGDTVLCRVVRVQPRQAVVSIVVVGEDGVLEADGWQGVIRSQDVRATEKDRVRIWECFRPGDIVRAQVVSLRESFLARMPRLYLSGGLADLSCRYHWATRQTIICQRPRMNWASSWPRARLATPCFRSAGRSSGTRRPVLASRGRLRSRFEAAEDRKNSGVECSSLFSVNKGTGPYNFMIR